MVTSNTIFNTILICLTIFAIIALIFAIVYVFIPMNVNLDKLSDRFNYDSINRTDTIPIESLKDGSSISGYFSLGSGYINGRDVYIYYTKNEDGGYIRHNVDVDVSAIYMDEDSHPYIIGHYVETRKYKQQFIHSYSFHVPNGTIVKSFSV